MDENNNSSESLKGRSGWLLIITVGLICTVTGGMVGGWMILNSMGYTSGGTLFPGNNGTVEAPRQIAEQPEFNFYASDLEKKIIDIANTSMTSVVQVRVKNSFQHPGFGKEMQTIQSSGSGFIYDSQGHIVTNYHVVEDANDVEIVYSDGTLASGKVIGWDRMTDLAVIKVNKRNDPWRELPLAQSGNVEVGQLAVAIGSPLGGESQNSFGLNKAPTVTLGIIGAKDRTMPVMNKEQPNIREFQIEGLLQTDAAINPGNSGGPLLNLKGEVIGVNTAIILSTQGIGFAIPASILNQVIPDLISQGGVDRPYLGIIFRDALEIQGFLKNLLPVEDGVVVMSVEAGSPAEQAGLNGMAKDSEQFQDLTYDDLGDIIIAVNEVPVNGNNLVAELLQFKPGDKINLTVIRKGSLVKQELVLGKR